MNILRECTYKDLDELCKISCKTFDDAFGHLNIEDNMKIYLEQAFNKDKLKKELSNRFSFFYFLYSNDNLIGYLKLNEYDSQSDIKDPDSMEIERIYVVEDYQGKGLGSILIDKAVNEANKKNKNYLWLGVWEKNRSAIRFYNRK